MNATAATIGTAMIRYGLPAIVELLRVYGNVTVSRDETDRVLIAVQNEGGRIPPEEWAKLIADFEALKLAPPDQAEIDAAR